MSSITDISIQPLGINDTHFNHWRAVMIGWLKTEEVYDLFPFINNEHKDETIDINMPIPALDNDQAKRWQRATTKITAAISPELFATLGHEPPLHVMWAKVTARFKPQKTDLAWVTLERILNRLEFDQFETAESFFARINEIDTALQRFGVRKSAAQLSMIVATAMLPKHEAIAEKVVEMISKENLTFDQVQRYVITDNTIIKKSKDIRQKYFESLFAAIIFIVVLIYC